KQRHLHTRFGELLRRPTSCCAGSYNDHVIDGLGTANLAHNGQYTVGGMSFAGKRVLSLESRRAVETAELIRRNGGEPFVAPSMREVPLERNEAAFQFAERLLSGEFDMMIFLTGVGTR